MQTFSSLKNAATRFFSNVYDYAYDTLFGQGQTIVLSQLAEFLKLTAPDNDTSIEIQQSLNGGHCAGLSRIHGPMGQVDKLRWWEAALIEVALWDKKLSSLDTPILLPDAENNAPVPLRTIINKVLNYVVSSHFNHNVAEDFRIKGVGPTNAYNPSKKFEISTNNGHHTIKRNTKISGYFSKHRLNQLLDENYFTNATCLVHSDSHMIRIGYLGNNSWLIYDPNYTHNMRRPIHKILNKDKLIDELIRIQGNSLTLQVAHLKIPKAKNLPRIRYLEMLENNLPEILQKHGLHHIIRETPHHLPHILKKAEKDSKVAEAITKAIGDIPDQVWNAGRYTSILCSSLRSISQWQPKYFDQFVKIAQKSKEGATVLKKAFEDFSVPDSTGSTALSSAAKYIPTHLPNLIHHLKKMDETGPKVVAESLSVKHEKSEKPGLLLIEKYTPEQIPELLELAMKHDTGYKHLCTALSMEFKKKELKKDQKNIKAPDDKKDQKLPATTPEKITCFEHLVTTQSKNLPIIMSALYESQDKSNHTDILLSDSPKLFMLIARHQPQHFEKLISAMAKNSSAISSVGWLLRRPVEDKKECGLYILNQQVRSYLPRIIDLAAEDGDACHNLLHTLVMRVNGKTCFEHIIEHDDKNTLPAILESITHAITKHSQRSFSQNTLPMLASLAAGIAIFMGSNYIGRSQLNNIILDLLATMTNAIGMITGGLLTSGGTIGTGLRIFQGYENYADAKEAAGMKLQLNKLSKGP